MTVTTKKKPSEVVVGSLLNTFETVKSNFQLAGYVIASPVLKKEHLIVKSWITISPTEHDGNYYRYNLEVVPLVDAVAGKRGVKAKLICLKDWSSMGSSSAIEISTKEIMVVKKMRFKHLPEVVKVVEKEGWSVY